jgi:hypothetical protein
VREQVSSDDRRSRARSWMTRPNQGCCVVCVDFRMESSFNPSAAELWGQEVAWALSPIPHPPHPSVALHGIHY